MKDLGIFTKEKQIEVSKEVCLVETETYKIVNTIPQFFIKQINLKKDSDSAGYYFLIELRDEKKAQVLHNSLYSENSIRRDVHHEAILKVKTTTVSPGLIKLTWEPIAENDVIAFMQVLQDSQFISKALLSKIEKVFSKISSSLKSCAPF